MTKRPPVLTDEQIRTQHFLVPDIILKLVLDPVFARHLESERRIAEAEGDRVDVIGFPDGTTLFWSGPAGEKIDLDALVRIYKSTRRLADLNAMSGERNEH